MRKIFFVLTFISAIPPLSGQWHPGDPLVDPRDGQTYRTVAIGSQVWMAENLNIGTMVASSRPGVIMQNNGIIEKYCWNDDQGNCDGSGGLLKRGGFYEWEEAVQYWNGQPSLPVRGLCPEGWHIPSNAEWNTLLNQLGGAQAYRQMLPGGGSGFDALMTGYRCTMNGAFRPSAMSADTRTYFWTAEQTDAGNAPFVEVGQNSLQAISFQKSIGLCVRCIWNGQQTGIGNAGEADGYELLSLSVDIEKMLTFRFRSLVSRIGVIVFDILGKVVATRDFETVDGENVLQLDLSGCAAGLYVVQVMSDAGLSSHKFQVR